MNDIKKYYESEEFQPTIPPNSKWRHYRVKTAKGVWKKIPVRIKTVDDLKKWINKLGGIDIYYSNSYWYHPERISSKKELLKKPVSNNWLLGSDLVFDIDAKKPITIESLEEARKVTNNILTVLQDNDRFELQYISFTGYKGFRIAYTDKQPLHPDPKERLLLLEKERKELLQQIEKTINERLLVGDKRFYQVDVVFDEMVTTNPLGVIRVLGTAHSTTKFISTKISFFDITRSVEEILSKVPRLGAFRIPHSWEMTTSDEERTKSVFSSPRPRLPQPLAGVLKAPPASNLSKIYFTNTVLGTKNNFVPVIIYDERTEYEQEVLSLQKKYSLGTIKVFSCDGKNYLLSNRLCQKKFLQKILSETKAINKNQRTPITKIPVDAVLINEIPFNDQGTVPKSKAHSLLIGEPTIGTAGKELLQIAREKQIPVEGKNA